MIKSNTAKQFVFTLTLIGAIAFASTALADSDASDYESAQQINAANELLRKGEIDQAIEGYGNVAHTEANGDELKYNMAVAQYRKSDIPAATSLFAETAGSADASIAARSRFNLGNCLYATALQTAEQDKPAAIEQLRTAISHFRGSLRSMPDNEDARANIELAAELIRKLKDEQKQEDDQQQQNQDQQDQDQQDQQQQNQDQQNQDEQDQEQQDSQQNQDDQQQNQDQQNKDSQDSQSQDSKSDQSQQDNQQSEQSDESESDESKSDEQRENESDQDNSDESQQTQDATEQEQSEEPSSQPKSEQNQAEQEQPNKQSRSNTQQSKEDEASLDEQPQDNQPVPTGELTAADEQGDNKEPNGSVAMADPNAKDDGLMTKEEALKMLQAVRDRDMLRRLRQQQRERSRNVRVDRDW